MEENTLTQTATPGGMRYAGFWIRFLAYLIDAIILVIIGYIFFPGEITEVQGSQVSIQFSGWQNLIWIIYILGFWIWRSTTPGKMICGLRIVDTQGNPLSPGKAIIRLLGYFASTIVLLLGFIWIGFDKQKQGWHDKIAKTYVVKSK